MAREGPRVDLADPDDGGIVQIPLEAARGAPGRGARRDLANDESGDLEPRGFHVLAVHAVVPDVWIGHGDDLTGVGGIGEDFLVAAEARVEDHFPLGLPHPAKRNAPEESTVFQGQDGPRSPFGDMSGAGAHEYLS